MTRAHASRNLRRTLPPLKDGRAMARDVPTGQPRMPAGRCSPRPGHPADGCTLTPAQFVAMRLDALDAGTVTASPAQRPAVATGL